MILVRDIFQVQFGRMKEAVELCRQMISIEEADGVSFRVLTDLVGTYYTLVMESEYESLGAYEEIIARGFASEEWRASYQKVVPLLESGRREIFTIVQ